MASGSRIDPEDLHRLITQGKAPAILDVRTAAEFDEGHVPGAEHMPFQSVLARARQLRASPGEPLIVYCGHGPRAYIAAAALRARGFRAIVFLKGHMTRWRRLGLPEE
jgi:rhodanese-related sulfurtransferase